jgi:hypothetical protein
VFGACDGARGYREEREGSRVLFLKPVRGGVMAAEIQDTGGNIGVLLWRSANLPEIGDDMRAQRISDGQ